MQFRRARPLAGPEGDWSKARRARREWRRGGALALILPMNPFSLASGSACSSGERGPSRVLKAIGASDDAAIGSIRFGLGKSNTAEQLEMLIDDLKRVVRKLREIST